MKKKRLFWRIFPLMLLITALSLAGVVIYAARVTHHFHTRMVKNHLADLAAMVVTDIETGNVPFEEAALRKSSAAFPATVKARFTIVDPQGKVFADTAENPLIMGNHADRPEIKAAMTDGLGSAVRYSSTIRRNMLYVARPVRIDGRLVGIVRTAQPLAFLDEQLADTLTKLLLGGAAACLLAFLLSLWLTRGITVPLQELQAGAARFAKGHLDTHLRSYNSLEMDGLAKGINKMAGQLAARLRAIQHDHSELQAVISSMIEGVMAVDNDQRVFKINAAATRILGVKPEDLIGHPLGVVVRNAKLEELVARTLASAEPVEGEVIFYGDPDRVVRLHGTRLETDDPSRRGAVIVLNDITRLRRLESMRRQFASNVSHELKTPITSIQGYVETLLDGALNENPDDVRGFLEIILRQTKRLNAIMEDILMLSRIEQDDGDILKMMIRLKAQVPVKGAVDQCYEAATEKGIQLLVECPETASLKGHPRLLEQAIVNLLTNAVNYSPRDESVTIKVEETRTGVAIHVQDHGVGIPREHLGRIFERFYRVDKARSRDAGGTGLGLAIVKHIAQLHNGRVDVISAPGKGSTFSLILPGAEDDLADG
ncbi:MAG: ATP-binding protein [Lentisphaeria bacterium]|nr:ATP-binding protein [Lentisphaeria bacterium]